MKSTADAGVSRPSKAKVAKDSRKSKTEKDQEVEPTNVGSEVETDDETQALVKELDSGAEEEVSATAVAEVKPGQKLGKIPKPAKAKKKASSTTAEKEEPGVIYVGRIPHGFYEHEMRQYFSQFGPIRNLRLSRNPRTGASRHYAFIEFESAETADIVARTMDNYLLFGHILKCKVVPPNRVHPDLWKGANRRFKKIPWSKIAAGQLARPATETTWNKRLEKEEGRRAKRAEKLKELGYEFDAPALAKLPEVKALPAAEEPVAEIEAPAQVEAPAEPEKAGSLVPTEGKDVEVVLEPKKKKSSGKRRASKA